LAHDAGAGSCRCEVLEAPRLRKQRVERGTLADDHASSVIGVIGVIDAATMQCLATLHAPQVIPFGFHAAWAS
jgi:hypothetical protein